MLLNPLSSIWLTSYLQQTVTQSEVSPPDMFQNTSFTTFVGNCIQTVINEFMLHKQNGMSCIKSKLAYMYCADWTLHCINFHKIGISCWLSTAAYNSIFVPTLHVWIINAIKNGILILCKLKSTLCKLLQDGYHCCSLIRFMAVLTEVPIYQTVWHHIPGKCNLDGVHQETPRSHKNNMILGYVYIFTAIRFFICCGGNE